MAKKKTEVTKKTYILDLKDGNTRKVEVPSNWKLTFGMTAPYAAKGQAYNQGLALRFYEGTKDNLRIVFTDVTAFRDASIPVVVRRTEVQRQVMQKHTPGGNKDVVVEARVTEWVNPDDDEPDNKENNPFLKLLAANPAQAKGDLPF